MDLNTAIDVIESVAGFTDADTSVGEAWAVVMAQLNAAPAPAGEVADLVAALKVIDKMQQEWVLLGNDDGTASPSLTMPISLRRFTVIRDALTRAADLLEQRQAAPVPVASDTRYEFSVYDKDYTEQAGGSAPTYAQALSEGQHYLAQYQQDGPHTLEVRRVEVLPPGAFPVPDDAPVPLLPEGAQVIEPTNHTILVPAPVPVAVSERPWEREGWCDSEGRCWIHCPGQSWDTWVLTVPQNAIDGAHCLPATALPKPSGEAQP